MLPESSKIQRTGEIPEGTDPGRSIRSPGKGDGSNCRKLKFSLISGWRPEHEKVSAVNFLWRILSARAKRSWLWYQRKPRVLQSTAVCSVQQRRTGISMWEGIPNVCSSGRRRTGRCGDPGIRVNTGNGGIGNHAKQAYQSL